MTLTFAGRGLCNRLTASAVLVGVGVPLLLVAGAQESLGAPAKQRVSADFLVYPSAHPQEDLYGCGNGWVEEAYRPLRNGGAVVTCVQLHHGETRDGYYSRRK